MVQITCIYLNCNIIFLIFAADVTAEELFNMFFGGGFHSANNVYVRRGNGQWRRQQDTHAQPQREVSESLYQ